jgi:hypothetical protein
LLYFQGVSSFVYLASATIIIEVVTLSFIAVLASKCNEKEVLNLLISGLWSGCFATLAYDIVRLPIALSGVPVFKAISYFGTVLLTLGHSSPVSEIFGWAYHLSNGISFGLMYAALISKPGPITAILWGMMLEGVMLLTPYAEVFGYRRDAKFLAITIGAHAVYGLVLWLALRTAAREDFRWTRKPLIAGFVGVPLGLAVMAADFHQRYASHLPPSPPAYLGPHLYTTWDVPEPDRIVVMWMTRRWVEPQAQFHFIPPFETIRYGRPFDLPEAEIRRQGTLSASEYVLSEHKLKRDPKLEALVRMTHLNEITPWMLASDPAAGQLTEQLRTQADQLCGKALNANCAEQLFAWLDRWYEQP